MKQGFKNLDLDQHFEQFDLEVYNQMIQTKPPAISNRFFMDGSQSTGLNTQVIKQVYGSNNKP